MSDVVGHPSCLVKTIHEKRDSETLYVDGFHVSLIFHWKNIRFSTATTTAWDSNVKKQPKSWQSVSWTKRQIKTSYISILALYFWTKTFTFLPEDHLPNLSVFSRATSRADDVQTTCGWHVDDVRMTYAQHESEISCGISLADHICRPHVVRKRACRLHGMATSLHKAYWLPCFDSRDKKDKNFLLRNWNWDGLKRNC